MAYVLQCSATAKATIISVMAQKQMPLVRFFEELDQSLNGLFEPEPAFALILGAGASATAGIPLTWRMVELLEFMVTRYRFPHEKTGENDFSELISTIGEYAGEWEVREFILRCIRRGSREPNVTHLLAANLASFSLFRPIITTNFDDLTLAGFWNLPVNEVYREPYVIYDPRSVRLSQVSPGEDVPVIIKAHGHHTQYGMGFLEHQVRSLAPHVKRAIRWAGEPRVGYLVVGYSGEWADGVMEALKDPKITKGKRIYWFFRRQPPEAKRGSPLAELLASRDVHFVRCDDSDYLFLKMWQFMSGMRGSAWLLHPFQLFTPQEIDEHMDAVAEPPPPQWWHPAPAPTGEGESRAQQRRDLGIPALRKKLLPILKAIDDWDDGDLLRYECLPPDLRDSTVRAPHFYFFGTEAPPIAELRKTISPRIAWTRRNRKLLKLALDVHTDPSISYDLLSCLDRMGNACAAVHLPDH